MRTIHDAVLNEISCSRTIPQTILDVGSGNGVFTQTVSATFPRSDITAIDTSDPRLFSSGNITFLKGSVEQLPFALESFDLVITVLSLHHWKEKNKGISEIYRVLKKGGTFTDKKRVSGYLNTAGFEDITIRLVPNTMRSLYLITAKK